MSLDLDKVLAFVSAMNREGVAGPLRIPRGVRKFRSIEEAQADRDRYEQQKRVDRIRAERLRK